MKNHHWILPAGRHAKVGPATRLAEAAISESPAQTARAMLILALVVGGGTESAALATSSNAATVSALPVKHVHATAHPWVV
jgi:hypothetical protein